MKDIYLPLKLHLINHYFAEKDKINRMPKIQITNLFNKTVFAQPADNSIFDAFQNEQVDWMHACGTKGRCTTCKFVVIDGANNISPENEVELNYRKQGKLKDNERLACQCKAVDDITIAVPEIGKMPHINYSN